MLGLLNRLCRTDGKSSIFTTNPKSKSGRASGIWTYLLATHFLPLPAKLPTTICSSCMIVLKTS